MTVDCAEYRDFPDQMFGTVTAEDNCTEDVTITFDVEQDTIISVNAEIDIEASSTGCYTVLRLLTLTDDCGNSTQIEQYITVEDNTPPVYQGPGQISIPAEEYDVDGAYPPDVVWAYPVDSEWESFPIGYIDDCSGFFTCTAEDFPISGGCANQPHPAYNGESATYLRLLTITDLCGNSSTAEVIINLIDDDAPVFDFVPADAEFTCSEDVVLLDPTYYDLVDENVVLEYSEEMTDLGCANNYVLVRHWTITDNCDNSTEAEQTITVNDNVAPSIDAEAQSLLLECAGTAANEMALADWVANLAGAAASDNCIGDVTWSTVPANPALSDDCGETGSVTVTFVATDDCGNSSETTATFTVEDTTAPEFTSVPADYTAECSDEHPLENATASDACGDVTIVEVADTTAGDCAQEYIVVRTFTATDECGNSTSASQTITIQDTTAPELTIPADYTAECSDEHPLDDATAEDNCGMATIEMSADTVWSCTSTYEVTRTFTATDECGNSTTASQVINIVDTTAPVFNEALPGDLVEDCTHSEAAVLTAFDNCQDVEVLFEESIDSECANQYTITRTWTATDDCGNSTSHTQIVSVIDETAPMLSGTPTNNGESLDVPYDSYCGEVTVPQIADVMATDFCSEVSACDTVANQAANAAIANALGAGVLGEDGYLDLLTSVTATGMNNPFITGGEYTEGLITTPVTMADGETCDNNPNQHGMRMFNFLGGEYYVTDAGTMVKDQIDGTATITMTVSNGIGSLEVEATFGELMNWEEWVATPGLESYKSDCGLGDHMTWDYAILLDGTITGVEGTAFEGTELTMSHQPANQYFGFQFGVGANNKNAKYGFSGWYYYGGTLVIDGEESSAMGSGDLFGDLDFLQPWETTFHFCAEDACGNDVTYSYSFVSTGELQDPLLDGGVEGEQDSEPTILKDLIEITTLFPNPTATHATLTIEAKEDVSAKVHLYTMDGTLVQQVFDGPLYEGWPTTLELYVNNLESGMYQVRVSSKNFVTTKKLLVIE